MSLLIPKKGRLHVQSVHEVSGGPLVVRNGELVSNAHAPLPAMGVALAQLSFGQIAPD
jgi:hypothetical protein